MSLTTACTLPHPTAPCQQVLNPEKEQLYNPSALLSSRTRRAHVQHPDLFLVLLNLTGLSVCFPQDGSHPDGTKSPRLCSASKQMVRREVVVVFGGLPCGSVFVHQIKVNMPASKKKKRKKERQRSAFCRLDHQFSFPKSHMFSS